MQCLIPQGGDSTTIHGRIEIIKALAAAFLSGAEMRLYSGEEPASVDMAIGPSCVRLVTIREKSGAGLTFEGSAPHGIMKNRDEEWVGKVVADGTATFFRLVQPHDTDSASTTAVRAQGSAGMLGADLFLSWPHLKEGTEQTIGEFKINP